MSSWYPTAPALAAGACVALPWIAKLLSHVSLSTQLLLAVIVYITISAEQQHRSGQPFVVSRTVDREEQKASRSSGRLSRSELLSTSPITSTSNRPPRRTTPTNLPLPPLSATKDDSTFRLDYAEKVARIRDQQCPQLLDACYLDAAAAPPFPAELVQNVATDLGSKLYSNPHSKSPSAVLTADAIDATRVRVVKELFGIATPHDWHLVFTSGTTASLKLVAEAFDWQRLGGFRCLAESHTSLLGIRDLAVRAGSSFATFDETTAEAFYRDMAPGLIGLPLQCNATGRRYGNLMRRICKHRNNTFVLVDAASYLSSSSRLDFAQLTEDEQPDFVAFSFYKIFGYPTGLGGLLVKKSAAHALSNKIFFGGGTVDAIVSESRWTKPRKDFVSRFEDGTVNIHGILAIPHAIDYYNSRFGSWKDRKAHTQAVTRKAFVTMSALCHANGNPVVRVYTQSQTGRRWIESQANAKSDLRTEEDPKAPAADDADQGPILNFSVLTADGRVVPPQEVDRLACVSNIHLRMGRHCNAGFVTNQLGATPEQLQLEYAQGVGCDDSGDSDVISTSLRASLCLLNTDEDIQRLVGFVRRFFQTTVSCEATLESGNASTAAAEAGTVNCAHDRAMEGAEGETFRRFRLDTVTLYPIKSCAGQNLRPGQQWKLTPHGLEYDREWILVDLRTGKGLSQKRHPRMALIRPRIDLDARKLCISIAPGTAGIQTTSSPRCISINLDDGTQYASSNSPTSDLDPTKVCTDSVMPRAHTCSRLRQMLSDHLGVPCTLAMQSSGAASRHSKLGSSKDGDRIPLVFSNESPFLLINKASVDRVTRLMSRSSKKKELAVAATVTATGSISAGRDAVDGDGDGDGDEKASDSGYSSTLEPEDTVADPASFRANFLISPLHTRSPGSNSSCLQQNHDRDQDQDPDSGAHESQDADAWIEDRATRVQLGPHTFGVLGQCRRCQMVCIDQSTGLVRPETFQTLAKHRRNSRARIIFGSHLAWRPALDGESISSQALQDEAGPSASRSPTVQVGMPVTLTIASSRV
ncbi:PLP-dependent transferase [Testicularia cyperi]|uniref:PLP-dependent transferase n=1 Tax=Testicularia cyperi TaxID=1882483 RepID=A0A317XKG6_9BASI|nr:PLP-dependent transferase [Testicularia cyperi]